MSKKLLFITDPLKGLKQEKDTSIFMMEESIALGARFKTRKRYFHFHDGGVYRFGLQGLSVRNV